MIGGGIRVLTLGHGEVTLHIIPNLTRLCIVLSHSRDETLLYALVPSPLKWLKVPGESVQLLGSSSPSLTRRCAMLVPIFLHRSSTPSSCLLPSPDYPAQSLFSHMPNPHSSSLTMDKNHSRHHQHKQSFQKCLSRHSSRDSDPTRRLYTCWRDIRLYSRAVLQKLGDVDQR